MFVHKLFVCIYEKLKKKNIYSVYLQQCIFSKYNYIFFLELIE